MTNKGRIQKIDTSIKVLREKQLDGESGERIKNTIWGLEQIKARLKK